MSDRGRYDDIFLKTDADLDGFVSGHEVKEIFMQSGLSQNVLAHIWYGHYLAFAHVPCMTVNMSSVLFHCEVSSTYHPVISHPS